MRDGDRVRMPAVLAESPRRRSRLARRASATPWRWASPSPRSRPRRPSSSTPPRSRAPCSSCSSRAGDAAVAIGEPIVVSAQPGERRRGTVYRRAVGPAPVAEPSRVSTADAITDGRSRHPAARTSRRFVSPLVRRLARERGIELDAVTGTGPGGRIVRHDLERSRPPAGPSAAPAAHAAVLHPPAPAAARRCPSRRCADRSRAGSPRADDRAALLPRRGLPRRRACSTVRREIG